MTTLDNDVSWGIVSYEWSVENILNDLTAIKRVNPKSTLTETMNADLQKQIRTTLLNGVTLNSRILKIPQTNLKEFVIVQFRVKATLNYYNSLRYEEISEVLKVPIRKVLDYRTTDDLGVPATQIQVTPKSGISGVQKFTASYSICNVPTFTRPPLFNSTWKYQIEVISNNKSLTQQQSAQCQDSISLLIPANKLTDVTANVIFTFSYGDNYFQATRQIKALRNS